jgi:dTDP-4-dehydrorhamnose reductase
VGASGFIGNWLYRSLKKRRDKVKGTYFSDNKNIDADDAVYLDLEKGEFGRNAIAGPVKYVVLCHGISSVDRCKLESDKTRKVNVKNTVNYLRTFDPKEMVPLMLSTSMVYNDKDSAPVEDDNPDPIVEYGRQKLEVERFIEESFPRHIILRLTKVFGIQKNDGTIFTSWLDRFEKRETVLAADDLFISPVYVNDVIAVLLALMDKELSGKYNLGGRRIESIHWFCKRVAARFSVPENLVWRVVAKDLGFVETRPKYNSLCSEKVLAATEAKLTDYEKSFDLMAKNYGK